MDEKKPLPLDLSSCTQAVLAPGVLKAFGATHTSIGGAFSEIIDNFVDAGASYVNISLKRPLRDNGKGGTKGQELLIISGDGIGCDARESLMVGKSEKKLAQSKTIGGYGLGGQSSLMFLAEDALVISLQAGGRVTISLMSTTMHTEQGITNQLLTPHFDYCLEGDGVKQENGEEEACWDPSQEPENLSPTMKTNLQVIYRYSPCSNWAKLYEEMLKVQNNKTKTGYRVLLYNLKNMNTTEDKEDILGISEETDRSLRHVLAYKYLVPKLTITLQSKRILPVFWEGILVKATRVSFHMGDKKVTVLMGFNPSRRQGQRQHQLHSWLCVYVLGRLIRVYELRSELRIQSKSSMYGSGLCCIIDDVEGYLPLGMNKESVKAGQEYSALKERVAEYVRIFYKHCKGQNTITHLNETLERVRIPIPFQVHDDKATRPDVIDYKPADPASLNLYTFQEVCSKKSLVPEDTSRPVDCFDFPSDPTEPVPAGMGRNLFRGIETRGTSFVDVDQENDLEVCKVTQSQVDDDDVDNTQPSTQPQTSLNSLPSFPQRWSKRQGASDVNYAGMQDDRQQSKSVRRVQDPYGKIRKKLHELFKSQPKQSCVKGFFSQKVVLNKRLKSAASSQDFAELLAEYETLILNEVKTKLWLGEEYIVKLRDQGFCMGTTRDEWYQRLFAIDADLERCVDEFLFYCTSAEFVNQRVSDRQEPKSTRELAQAAIAHLRGQGLPLPIAPVAPSPRSRSRNKVSPRRPKKGPGQQNGHPDASLVPSFRSSHPNGQLEDSSTESEGEVCVVKTKSPGNKRQCPIGTVVVADMYDLSEQPDSSGEEKQDASGSIKQEDQLQPLPLVQQRPEEESPQNHEGNGKRKADGQIIESSTNAEEIINTKKLKVEGSEEENTIRYVF